MPPIVYVETNLLMSFATGRDLATNRLVLDRPPHAEFAIPSVCYMEAFSTFETLKKRRDRFSSELQNKINDCDRGIVWADKDLRLKILHRSLLGIEETFERFRGRLRLGIQTVGAFAIPIENSASILKASIARSLIRDTTDNLILATILDHARTQPEREFRALLTENHTDFHDNLEARRALDEAGIKYFRQTQPCRDWLDAHTRPTPG
ncbi:MAG: hypothetical protein JWN86_487 [Planctomycetota bacterium]|nr:hypothetical protein [Planctomycetota bacterium]